MHCVTVASNPIVLKDSCLSMTELETAEEERQTLSRRGRRRPGKSPTWSEGRREGYTRTKHGIHFVTAKEHS